MSDYRVRQKEYLYNPSSSEPFRISRSKIDLFTECPRCFYLDLRLGIKRPSLPGFTLNIAVDHLLKKEFDVHRAHKTRHPLIETYHIDAIPFEHKELEKWRHNFTGVDALHKPTNLTVYGAIDDVWVNPKDELLIVDYKATSKREKITLDGRWGGAYKRQMEVYQWLFRQNGFRVSDTGYFVYANGIKDREVFDKKLEFDVEIISYVGDSTWIEDTLQNIHQCLASEAIPSKGKLCEYCPYREEAGRALQAIHLKSGTSRSFAKRNTGAKRRSTTASSRAPTLF